MLKKDLEARAWRITEESCEYRQERGRMCRADDGPSCGPCTLVRGIMAALREVAEEARAEAVEITDKLMILRNTLGDLRAGFSRTVDPARWVADMQAYIDEILRRGEKP